MIPMPAADLPADGLKRTQVFSRPGAGFLYEMKAQLPASVNKQVDALWNNRKKGSINCEQEIIYKLSKSAPGQLGFGRLYGSRGSLERMEKECRGVLCKEFYHDIDVVNCHPVLLYQFAKREFEIDLPEVEKLCDNRDEYLAKICDNRDDAKTAVIKILYGGKNTLPFLEPLAQEVKKFTKTIMALPQYKELYEACKNYKEQKDWEKNVVTGIYGTFLSYILQTEERRCMLSMSDSFESQGWRVDVFCYDGVMIRKREGIDLEKAIRDAEKRVLVDTGYNLSLISKPFMTFKEFQDEQTSKDTYRDIEMVKYLDMKREFERTNFYFAPTHEYYEYIEGKTPLQMPKEHATEYYKRKWFFRKSERIDDYVQFFPMWRDDVTARTVRHLSLRPSEDPEVFQIPMKLKYQDVADGVDKTHLFLELVSLICNHQEPLVDFTLNWFAHCLQKPYEIPRVSLVVVGAKGVGKDTVFDFFMKHVIGSLFSTNFTSTEAYFEKHNCDRMHKLFVKLEEANAKVCLDNQDILKGRVTSEDDKFNPKGQKGISTDNVARLVMTANGNCPVNLSDKERRFVVMNASAEKRGDDEYWNTIRKELFNDAAGKSVASWLLERDISSLSFNTLPANDYQEYVMETRASSEQKFIEQWDGVEIPSSELFDLYKEYCIANNLYYVITMTEFGKKMMSFVKNGDVFTRRKNTGNFYRKERV